MANQGVSAICQTFLYWLPFSDKPNTELYCTLSATLSPDNQTLTYSQEKENLCNVRQTLCKQIIELLCKSSRNIGISLHPDLIKKTTDTFL